MSNSFVICMAETTGCWFEELNENKVQWNFKEIIPSIYMFFKWLAVQNHLSTNTFYH